MLVEMNKSDVRSFLLLHHHLSGSSLKGKPGIAFVFENLRSVQFDPLNPCGRNVDLVLQARVQKTHPNDYFEWLYEQRNGIETYDKELCVVPIEDAPLCQKQYSDSRRKKLQSFIDQNAAELASLLAIIQKNGPICALDIKDKRKINGYWSNPRWGKMALETLWKNGKLVITNRKNGRKYYDLFERTYSQKFVYNPTQQTPLTTDHIVRRLKSTGLLPLSASGSGWLGLGNTTQIKPVLNELIKSNIVTEVKITESSNRYVALREELENKQTNRNAIETKMVFLAPLDNLLWDRKLVSDLFDFDYKWEAYTPAHQRKFGHYVLPVLRQDRFIGRIQPVLTSQKILQINGCWRERNTQWDTNTKRAFDECLEQFTEYANAEAIQWNCPKPR